MVLFSYLVAAFAAVSAAAPATHVLHEKRDAPTRRWQKAKRVESSAVMPMRIGLAQRNLDDAEDLLMDVSDPTSKNYAKHWSMDDVHNFFAPAEETVALVKAWLVESGITADRIVHSDNKGWLAFDATTEEAESLLHTKYYEHHAADGRIKLGCDEYHVPHSIASHIDYITPGVHLSPTLRKRNVDARGFSPRLIRPGPPREIPPPGNSPFALPPGAQLLPSDLQDCGRNITPACIRALYTIPKATTAVNGNQLGLFESGDTYAQSDLNKFYALYSPNVPQGTAPQHRFVDGAKAPVGAASQYNTGESDIDMDMAFSLIYPQNVVLYQVDDRHRTNQEMGLAQPPLAGFMNTFLDAIDGSYCNYTAYGITGDSPGIDAEYPDPAPNGYKGQRQCGVYKPTNVISVSYGEAEYDLPDNYQKRQCNEFMKLGLQGVSILIASGDYGVASFPGDDNANGCLGNGNVFNPGYPNNCPYVTAVGGTRLYANQTVKTPESALQANLGGSAMNFSSAGGFSNVFTVPKYQQSTLSNYFKANGYTYKTYSRPGQAIGANGGIYNKLGRGMPDISANGAQFRAFTNGTDYHYYGTSLSAPLWASIINLINEKRISGGKKPVGFINPVLYQNPQVFYDIVNGSNPNCNSAGFKAVKGWDPVTGLGTPNYPKVESLFLGLQ